MDRQQIAEEVLAAVGGRDNVTANDICMTRLRIKTENPSLVDTDQLSAARGVLGFVKRGENGIEVVFGPGKVEAVHEALVKLTGIEGVDDDFAGSGAPAAPLHVHITQNPLLGAALAAGEGDSARDEGDETSVEDLVSLLDTMDAPAADEGVAADPDEASPARAAAPARVLVINGPNINMLGIREPDIYGHDSYQDMLRICHEAARDAGFVINPGAYTHTSIAILDAAKAVGLPMIEVHISKVDEREEFRKVSYIRAACFETIAGMGVEGYRKAMFDMAAHLGI